MFNRLGLFCSFTGVTRQLHRPLNLCRAFSVTKRLRGTGSGEYSTTWTLCWPKVEKTERIQFDLDIAYYNNTKSSGGQQKAVSGSDDNVDFDDTDEENPYDLVVKCDRLKDLNESGWKLRMSKKNDLWYQGDTFYPSKVSDFTTVAVCGVYNAGKTFILNNLSTTKLGLPSDDKVHTEGISIKRLKNDKILLLDTAGQNAPIEIADRKSISDKITSEKIL